MTIGEDRNKIEKIVDGSFDELSSTYHQLLEEDSRIAFQRDGTILQDASTSAIYHRLNLLPSTVLEKLQARWNRRVAKQRDTEEVLFSLAHRHDVSTHLLSAIRSIVAPTALSQTAKNALSAGITRSAIYSVAKLGKMLKSFSK